MFTYCNNFLYNLDMDKFIINLKKKKLNKFSKLKKKFPIFTK